MWLQITTCIGQEGNIRLAVIDNSTIQQFTLPGIVHQTLAGQKDGLKGTEVWMQTIEPGGETPVHYHDCEEVIVILQGSGRVSIEGKNTGFGPNTTLIIPPEEVHQVVNSGNEVVFLIAAFSSTPVRVFTPEGDEMPLPWQAS
jgi:mannose-6-phosphate isomerase-like protein (cupin superfamily)